MLRRAAANISVVYIIEEKKRIFALIKNILKSKNDKKCMFLYDDADFSEDIRKYIIGNDILTFRAVNSENRIFKNELFSSIDLTVLGDCRDNINIQNIFGIHKTRTFLLNTDNIDNFKSINFAEAQIITCGLKEKDTVIFSSIDIEENRVILDLQRSITNIKGEVVEPFEKKITVSIFDEMTETNEDLIFALTVLLFCGRL